MNKDISEKIEKDFSEPKVVLKELSEIELKDGEELEDRIIRSIIFLANGSIEELRRLGELYLEDYRDLLWQAEYEDPEARKYDFNETFEKNGLS